MIDKNWAQNKIEVIFVRELVSVAGGHQLSNDVYFMGHTPGTESCANDMRINKNANSIEALCHKDADGQHLILIRYEKHQKFGFSGNLLGKYFN